MKALHSRPRAALLISTFVAVGTVVAIAASDRPSKLWHALLGTRPVWLAAALGAELAAYCGYVVAYRSAALRGDGRRLPVMLTVRLVVAGFGPFVPLGGFAFDRLALESVHESNRRARAHVTALGVIEYMLLAPVACVCAAVLFFDAGRASPLLTLPWILAVPPGFALAWWLTRPSALERLRRSSGRLRAWVCDTLDGVAVLRRVLLDPFGSPGALVGMAAYWAAEVACLYFALLCFRVQIGLPALVVAYGTGYAASRRSLPLGGAGVTEALLTIALIAVHVDAARALLAVVAYRLVNFLVPTLPGLLAHASLVPLLDGPRRGP